MPKANGISFCFDLTDLYIIASWTAVLWLLFDIRVKIDDYPMVEPKADALHSDTDTIGDRLPTLSPYLERCGIVKLMRPKFQACEAVSETVAYLKWKPLLPAN